MDNLDYWRLCDELGLEQAACLIAGVNPSSEIGSNCPNWAISEQPFGYHAALTAITHALRRKTIIGKVSLEKMYDMNGNQYGEIEDSIIIKDSTVEVESLRTWLASRGIKTGFFFPAIIASDTPDYLDPKHPRYAPKLKAAISAWQAVSNDATYANNGKAFKQNLINWLTSHASECGLIKDNGEINKEAIEKQIAMVANGDDKGGAPTTPNK